MTRPLDQTGAAGLPRPAFRSDGSRVPGSGPSVVVHVRLTPEELAALDRVRGGRSRSDAIREAVAALVPR